MQLRRQSNGEIITLHPASLLGTGGEARVYSLNREANLVAKIYHHPDLTPAQKLAAMIANPPEVAEAEREVKSIAWPIDLLLTAYGEQKIVGFLMPRVAAMRCIADFYNPRIRRQHNPLFNYFYLHRTARNLAIAVRSLHERGYVVGDINESNILVSETALVTLVDADSFQVRDFQSETIYRCAVGKPEFTPPELQYKSFADVDRLPEHDLFGLAVILFQLLMEGTHPFAGQFQGSSEPPAIKERIGNGHFVYGTKAVPYKPAAIAPPFAVLSPGLQALFIRCFEDGHGDPQARPTASAWQVALAEAEMTLRTCRTNEQHRYGDHLQNCPWCERAKMLKGRDPFPSQRVVQAGKHLYNSPLYNSPTDSKYETPKTLPILPSFQPHPGNRIPKYFHFIVAVVVLLLFITLVNFFFGSPRSTTRYVGDSFKPPSKISNIRPPETIRKEIEENMYPVPAGVFWMGSPDNNDNITPQHKVKISSFYISRFEVTQEQWMFVASLPKIKIDLDPKPFEFKGALNFPAEKVTWEEAKEFYNRLSYATGVGYRLPTEAEWEYACRGGAEKEDVQTLNDRAWNYSNSGFKTHIVGQKLPNALKLFDMEGNVAEWCEDWFDKDYYLQSPYWNPRGPQSGTLKVIRGGGWQADPTDCRSIMRSGYNPNTRSGSVGFRIVRDGKGD